MLPCLAPSHARPFTPPQGGSCRAGGGGPQLLSEATPGPSCKGCLWDWASGWRLHPARLLAPLPSGPKQRRLRQQSAGRERWEAVDSESSRLVSLLRNLRPPPPYWPLGRTRRWPGPRAGDSVSSGSDTPLPTLEGTNGRVDVHQGVLRPQETLAPGTGQGPLPAAMPPPPRPLPRPGQINIYLEKAKVRMEEFVQEFRPLVGLVA